MSNLIQLLNSDGSESFASWTGFTLMEVARKVFTQLPQDDRDRIVAILPSATEQPGVYALLVFTQSGEIADSTYRLRETK